MKKILINRGLAFKMILLIFSSISLVFAVIFLYNYKVSKNIIEKNIEENARNFTSSTVVKLEKVLNSVAKVPDNFAILIQNSNYSKENLLQTIRLIVENNIEIFGVTIAFEPYEFSRNIKYFAPYYYKYNEQIKYTNLGDGSYDYPHMDWYQIPKELNKPIWSEPYLDEGGGNIVMSTYAVPIYKTIKGEKKFIGIITADVSLDWLQKIVSSIRVSKSGYGFMISKTGKLVTHPIKETIMNETIFSIAEDRNYPALREIGRKMIQGKTGFEKPDYKSLKSGKASWISYAPITVNGWSLGIVYPIDELTADVTNLSETVFILGVGGGLFLLIVVILISRSITGSLRQLATATKEFSAGNFDVKLPEIKSRDEIGKLNQSFISMQKALRDTIQKLKTANDELEDYSHTLEEKVEQRTIELKDKNLKLDSAYKNVKTLSEIGQKITSTLNLELIFNMVYESVNSLLDATIFLILVYNKKENQLECKLSIERGETLPQFSFSMEDKNRFAVWCVDNRKPVFMNDVDEEYARYIPQRVKPKVGGYSSSMIYFPLVVENRVIGAISVQSFEKNVYDQIHYDIMNNLATYTAIALDNAFAYEAINAAHKELKEAQAQLVQAEKMASLGQLTAGIAHEIKNPLNFVNNFSELSIDLAKELRVEFENQKDNIETKTVEYVNEILNDLEQNVRKINEHGKRADSIVKGMLLHSRGKSGEFQKTDINNLLAEYVNLAYHGFRAQDSAFNVKIETNYDQTLEQINVVPQNLSRVFLNTINNACYSVNEKKKEKRDNYSPTLTITTKNLDNKIEVRIRDNGKGIPKEVLDKIFNPFFTTKPTGKGTGLGLSLSFDIIVQEHKGEIKVESDEGSFAEFIITLPKNLT
ncbi:MAG: cache domain-containing protein [Ignavibacteriales bacterium]|nr:cache domain-containing protein [Ignavibacteriales bacterium]